MAFNSRPVCFELEQTVELLRQLEASTGKRCNRRIQSELEVDSRISISPIQFNTSMFIEGSERRCRSHVGDTFMADATVVPSSSCDVMRSSANSTDDQIPVNRTMQQSPSTSRTRIISSNRLAVVRQFYEMQDIPDNVSNLLLKGSRDGTCRAYQSAWRSWLCWCNERSVDPLSPSLNKVLEYLTYLFESGKAYRTIGVHRSMLSITLPLFEGVQIGKHRLVIQLLKGIYNVRTPTSKYNTFWNADRVLTSVKKLGPNNSISLKILSQKTTFLLAIASYCRVSELETISHRSLVFTEENMQFSILRPTKSQRSGVLKKYLIKRLPSDDSICPVSTMESYKERTNNLRSPNSEKLFIGIKSPHEDVCKETIARWIKSFLSLNGVDTKVYSAHSTRGAAASRAFAAGTPCDVILATANWKKASTFHRFYNKKLIDDQTENCRL